MGVRGNFSLMYQLLVPHTVRARFRTGLTIRPCRDPLLSYKMASLDTVRGDLGLVVLYLSKAEARDKICRAIQYGSKFLSNGQPGPAQNVDKSTSLARKVFRLFKFVNDLQALISPPAKGTPLPLILLGKSKNAMLSTFLFLDQIVWAGRTGVYKNKERAEFLGRIAFYCFLGSNTCTTIIELAELQRLSKSMKKLEKDLKHQELYKNEQYRMKLKKSNERLLALIKSSLDIVVAVGLLQLAPKKVTPRVTGAFGFASSLIACYQVVSPPSTTGANTLLPIYNTYEEDPSPPFCHETNCFRSTQVALRTTLRIRNTVGKEFKEQLRRSSLLLCSAMHLLHLHLSLSGYTNPSSCSASGNSWGVCTMLRRG
ncbi:Peroxisomal membrane protein 11-5 [Triticum urartu]|uniref:Peroxisomal membrane protein 11-5 n=2 Tax=Triticum TaxID=4564 RepID=M8AD20_TRIUA|nr:Peroxisomal membrane protein 11-5 [Triticum urartu]